MQTARDSAAVAGILDRPVIQFLLTIATWRLLLLGVCGSIIVAETICVAMSYAFWGELRRDYVYTALVSAGVTSAGVCYLLIAMIAELRRARDSLHHEASRDPLTGVLNRRSMDEFLALELARLGRYNTQFSIIIFDIDYFKVINDQHGHVRGDHVLQQVVGASQACVRNTDILARYGGDEFVVIATNTEAQSATILAERIRAGVAQIKPFSGQQVSISVGVAEAKATMSAIALLAQADKALYAAKQRGRNTVVLADG